MVKSDGQMTSLADVITASVKKTTKKWTAQRKKEERNSRAIYTRSSYYEY